MISVTFPDIFQNLPGRQIPLVDPLRIVLLKLIENNPAINISISDFSEYDKCIKIFKIYDFKRCCFISVENEIVLIDYSENSNWRHGPIRDMLKNGIKCKAVIKFNCDNSSQEKCPIPVFPFLFPGPNDYRDCYEFRESSSYLKSHDVFTRITYSNSYSEKFLDCYHNNKFKHSIAAYWGVPPTKLYTNRRAYTELCKKIPNSHIITHSIQKSVSMEEYYKNISCSKFGIAIRGSAKFSHREMELSSIGIPWFGEDRDQIYYKPFLPGTHYIKVTPETLLDRFNYYNDHYDEALEIGLNAREYFNKWHKQTGLQLMFLDILKEITATGIIKHGN